MRCVGHQHAIASGKAEIGGQRSALVTAFFLDDLHQYDLSALDDVLDFVALAQGHALLTRLITGLGHRTLAATLVPATAAATAVPALVVSIVFGRIIIRIVVVLVIIFVITGVFLRNFAFGDIDRVDAVILVDFHQRGIEFFRGFAAHHIGGRVVLFLFLRAESCFFRRMFGFFRQQLFTILAGNLVIVGVDFGKGQEPVTVAAIVHKCSLQRRFDAGYFR